MSWGGRTVQEASRRALERSRKRNDNDRDTSCPVHGRAQASTSRQHPIRPDNTDCLQRPCCAYTGQSAAKTVGPALARKPVSCLRSLLPCAASAVTSRHYYESHKHSVPSWVRNGRTRRTDLSSCASELCFLLAARGPRCARPLAAPPDAGPTKVRRILFERAAL
jgi:hypothetical protein